MDSLKNLLITDSEEVRPNWGTSAEYWLCVLGYAVGFGSLWRFPFLIFENGGGAFLIPYLICFVCVAIPLFYWEAAIGQMIQKGPVSAFGAISSRLRGMGYAGVTVSFFVSIFYNVLLAYSWIYLIYSFQYPLPWSGEDDTDLLSKKKFFYEDVLELSSSIEELGGLNHKVFWAYLLSMGICYICIAKGIAVSGKLAYFTATSPYFLLVILMLRGFFLEGAGDGLLYIFKFEWKNLLSISVWYKAAAQTLFQLSLVSGALVTLSSYRNKHDSIKTSSYGIPIMTVLTGILCTFTVFPYMGHMSHILKIPIEQLPLQGPDLVFIAYPMALSLMPLPNLWAILFFSCLVLLGVDTQFTVLECISAFLADEDIRPFGLRLKAPILRFVPIIGCLICGFCLLTKAGLYYLAFFDNYCATGPMLVMCVLESIIFAFHPGMSEFKQQIPQLTHEEVPEYFGTSLKYISTPISTFLFVYSAFSLIKNLFTLPLWAMILGVMLMFLPLGQIFYLYRKAETDLPSTKSDLSEIKPIYIELEGISPREKQ